MSTVLTVQASSASDSGYLETVVEESADDVLTDDDLVINDSEASAHLAEAVQTNEIEGWPAGPDISASAAVLMDADTGTLLYALNADEILYPASTTKLLTCLIAVENLNLSDDITFSQSAIDAVPSDGSNIGMSAGETITVEQCLYGLMVGSGNECANALAEAVAGSMDAFVEMMNERAAELGCTNTHFVNANGLHDDEHYTTAYDLALIAQAFFANETCRTIGNCASYEFEATDTQPDEFTLTNKHELITGETAYSGIIGGKTGYTSQAHENLVTGCEQNGMTLICVVLQEDDPAQFEDTVTLFDYGYANFSKTSVESELISSFSGVSEYLTKGMDLLGSSVSAFSVEEGGYVILPAGTEISDLTAVYANDNSVTYYYGSAETGVQVGYAVLTPTSLTESAVTSVAGTVAGSGGTIERRWMQRVRSFYISRGLGETYYVNVLPFLVTIAVVSAFLIFLIHLYGAMQETRERARARRRRERRSHTSLGGFYSERRYERPDDYYEDMDRYGAGYHNGNNYRDDFYGSDVYGEDDYR